MDWTPNTQRAQQWFEALRDRICAAFEEIEREADSEAAFDYQSWTREEHGNPDPGGGTRALMKGKVFEKVGVNVSSVKGSFAPEFAATINGASADQPGFTDTGITQKNRIVFCPAGKNLHQSSDFLISADDRIKLAFLSSII